jgi:hypothetical protein
MPRNKPAEIAILGDPSPQWVSTSMTGLMPGTNLVPFTGDSIFVTSSHDVALDFWRDPNRFMGYYRVLPEDAPVPVDSLPGVYRCNRAMVMQEFANDVGRRVCQSPRLGRHHAA